MPVARNEAMPLRVTVLGLLYAKLDPKGSSPLFYRGDSYRRVNLATARVGAYGDLPICSDQRKLGRVLKSWHGDCATWAGTWGPIHG
jgi:hypothetical protein